MLAADRAFVARGLAVKAYQGVMLLAYTVLGGGR